MQEDSHGPLSSELHERLKIVDLYARGKSWTKNINYST